MAHPDEPDLEGWDRQRDGWMADHDDVEIGADVEPYDPDKDPVTRGIVPDPYAGGDHV